MKVIKNLEELRSSLVDWYFDEFKTKEDELPEKFKTLEEEMAWAFVIGNLMDAIENHLKDHGIKPEDSAPE